MTKDKSVFLALVLTFFFGPLGLFYATTGGAITLLALAAVGVVPTLGYVLIFVWPASMIWAVIAASDKHKAFAERSGPEGTMATRAH
jgi:hypothetical protein